MLWQPCTLGVVRVVGNQTAGRGPRDGHRGDRPNPKGRPKGGAPAGGADAAPEAATDFAAALRTVRALSGVGSMRVRRIATGLGPPSLDRGERTYARHNVPPWDQVSQNKTE